MCGVRRKHKPLYDEFDTNKILRRSQHWCDYDDHNVCDAIMKQGQIVLTAARFLNMHNLSDKKKIQSLHGYIEYHNRTLL